MLRGVPSARPSTKHPETRGGIFDISCKLTVADTFRIGCIGHLTSKDMHEVLDVVKETLKELGKN